MKSLATNAFWTTLLVSSVRTCMVRAAYPPITSVLEEEKGKHSSKHTFGRRLSLEKLPFASFMATKNAVDPKLGTELSALYENHTSSNLFRPSAPDMEEYISVDITFTGVMDSERAKEELSALGVNVDFISCFSRMCSTRIPVSALKDIASIDAVQLLRPVKAKTQAGLVVSEGDRAMFADLARTLHSVDGSGLMIGVLSDAYNCLGGASGDITSGDLPSGDTSIVIVADLTGDECIDRIDEGRAIMQLIHDVAPGARLAFRTAWRGEADFAAGILELAEAGCDVIVDDIIYEEEPMFQDGVIAQAADQVVSQGIPFFSAAGNDARNSWVAAKGFKPFHVNNMVFHRFGTDKIGSPIISMRIQIEGWTTFIFQWNEPYASVSGAPGSRSDLDIYFVINNSIVVHSEDFNIGGDPVERVDIFPSDYSDDDIVIVDFLIVKRGGPSPSYMKLHAFAWTASFEFATHSATSYGHSNAAKVAGVGAANYSKTPAFGVSPPEIEYYSSAGGVPIFLVANGTRLLKPDIRKQPRFTGPDGGATTFFRRYVDGIYRFYGTSASAPHVAAVAALMLEYKGGTRSMSPDEIYTTLARTAIDMDDPFTAGFDVGFDFVTGAGFVNASAALQALRAADCAITYNLYNSRTDTLVAPLTNGTTIASPPPCRQMNIEAVVPCANGGAVTLELFRGARLEKRRTEQEASYFLFGNQGPNVYDGRIAPGKYGIRARVGVEAWSPFTNFTMGGRC